MKLAWVVLVSCGVACGDTGPSDLLFTGDFTLVGESDWAGGQSCQYIAAADQTVCSWGRFSVSVDSVAISVFGTDVHQGDRFGPLLQRDSVNYAVRVGVGNGCVVFISGNTVRPNGSGVLSTDSLQFTGINLVGQTVRWAYTPVQVQRPRICG